MMVIGNKLKFPRETCLIPDYEIDRAKYFLLAQVKRIKDTEDLARLDELEERIEDVFKEMHRNAKTEYLLP